MKHSNAEIECFRAQHRTPDPLPSWMQPRRVPWRALVLLAVLAFVGGILRGVYVRALEHDSRMSITDIVAECQSEGKIAKIERSREGAVLAVRCDWPEGR